MVVRCITGQRVDLHTIEGLKRHGWRNGGHYCRLSVNEGELQIEIEHEAVLVSVMRELTFATARKRRSKGEIQAALRERLVCACVMFSDAEEGSEMARRW